MKNMGKGITSRQEDFSKWYNDLVIKGGLADYSEVRGCMVIKPYGFQIWERMKAALDEMFKETGHTNAYFPLFIPKRFFSKEAKHVEGFAKECAIVTHYRLMNNPDGDGVVVDPDAKLQEELIVRPTSETIIWDSYRKWIQSYRDLPLLINQWANVVRWEMRTRLFLRTAEFLWQEGHTAHATKDEAVEEAELMLDVYQKFVQEWLALPVLTGVKTEGERFAGAEETYCIEALMQDGKALQAGTSHFLAQNFAKAFDVKFLNKEGKEEYVWATSWGVSTRLVGALIMAHSDDKGLVLPPKLAPYQVVIVPILNNRDISQNGSVLEKADELNRALKNVGVRSMIDDDDTKRPGFKYAEHELKGVPLRIGLGARDLQNNTVELARRDTAEKNSVSLDDLVEMIPPLLDVIQSSIYKKAFDFRTEHTTSVDSYDEFKEVLENKGGFVLAHWDGTEETEDLIKNETKATIRCITLDSKDEEGKCIRTGAPSARRVVFAKAY